MRANAEVGPTKRKPRFLSAFANAADSGIELGTSSVVRGCGVVPGRKDHTKSARPPSCRRSSVARALAIVAAIFARLRMMLASCVRRATSRSSKRATTSGSKPAKARRKFSRRRRISAQDRPAWKASRLSLSNMPRSSRTGTPHSVS